MLEFWFNPQISVARKFIILIAIAIATAVLYWTQALPLNAILMFTGTGIIFLICRYCKIHFLAQKPHAIPARLMTWIPIALLIALIFAHAQHELLILGAQGIGFMALAVCLFSPISLWHKNPTNIQ